MVSFYSTDSLTILFYIFSFKRNPTAITPTSLDQVEYWVFLMAVFAPRNESYELLSNIHARNQSLVTVTDLALLDAGDLAAGVAPSKTDAAREE